MPAVTLDDTSHLPRIPVPGEGTRQRPVARVTTASTGVEGEGFPVRRAFAGVDLADLDPFVHLDQMGEVNYCPGEPKGTPWHPHRGFETVTYMIDGVIQHADSTGGGGVITDGATQWMTAGKGILHIETPPEDVVAAGGWFHGLQLWVNLPSAQKWVDPRYQDLDGDAVTLLTTPDGGALVRVIAGEVGGHRGPGSTRTPMTMLHATLAPGARLVLPWPTAFNALVYVLGGQGAVGTERRPVELGQLAMFGPGDAVTVEAKPTQDSRSAAMEVIVLGGQPIREPVAWYGPFVMNTEREIQEAFDDFRSGRLGTVPPAHPLATTEVVEETDAALD
jgi:redox-sensitive bicupin YhaK (pirin superfamily)